MIKPLILWGGTDINPKYYNEEPNQHTQHPDKVRDIKEFFAAGEAIKQGIPILGICRGAQLICVLNGGSLYQHSKPHQTDHSIECVNLKTQELSTQTFYNVPAAHHQIMKPSGKYEVLGWNPTPTKVWTNNKDYHMEDNCPEIIWWPETKCLGIQAHPEWAQPDTPWLNYINNLLISLEIDYSFNNTTKLDSYI